MKQSFPSMSLSSFEIHCFLTRLRLPALQIQSPRGVKTDSNHRRNTIAVAFHASFRGPIVAVLIVMIRSSFSSFSLSPSSFLPPPAVKRVHYQISVLRCWPNGLGPRQRFSLLSIASFSQTHTLLATVAPLSLSPSLSQPLAALPRPSLNSRSPGSPSPSLSLALFPRILSAPFTLSLPFFALPDTSSLLPPNSLSSYPFIPLSLFLSLSPPFHLPMSSSSSSFPPFLHPSPTLSLSPSPSLSLPFPFFLSLSLSLSNRKNCLAKQEWSTPNSSLPKTSSRVIRF